VCEHPRVSRTTIVVLVAVGATLAGLVLATNAQRLRDDDAPGSPSVAAGPQTAALAWRETYGSRGEELVFVVDSLNVTRSGWSARVGVENRSSVAWEIAPGATPDGTFGLALFETGTEEELEDRNQSGTLPAVRAAQRFDPELPRILEPASSWEGRMGASGALVARSWVRVVFGTFLAVGNPPEQLDDRVVWITDLSYHLEE
jgi:hypothetical protein